MRQNAIVDVCNDLEAQNLIVREEPDRRRNCKLQLSPQCFIFIGLEHHLTGANFVAVDAIGGKLASQSVTLPQDKRLDQLLAATENFISPFKCESICALGILTTYEATLTYIRADNSIKKTQRNEYFFQKVWLGAIFFVPLHLIMLIKIKR